MGRLCLLVSRRSFLHGMVVGLGLCSCKATPTPSEEGFELLREPVSISLDALAKNDGAYTFEAWLSPAGDSDKLLDGILLKTGDRLAAYSLYCPHEACMVKLKRDSSALSSVVENEAALPSHPVLFCACHFSVFDPRASGERISGPAERGLYRFLFEQKGGIVYITHVETAILGAYA